MPAKLNDRDALDRIAAILSEPEWDSEAIEWVGEIVARTDRPSWRTEHQNEPQTEEEEEDDEFYQRQYLVKAREHHAAKLLSGPRPALFNEFRVMYRHYDGTEVEFSAGLSAESATGVHARRKSVDTSREYWIESRTLGPWMRVDS